MLTQRIGIIPPITVSTVSGISAQLDIACHQAACYWLFHELHGDPPEGWAWVDGNLSDSTGLMTKLARYGRSVSQSDIAGLANGTVLVLTDLTNIAKHTCVLDNLGQIAGYNQTDWFTSPGVRHGFSTHNKTHIKWRSAKKIKQNNDAEGLLFAIPEKIAVDFAKFNF